MRARNIGPGIRSYYYRTGFIKSLHPPALRFQQIAFARTRIVIDFEVKRGTVFTFISLGVVEFLRSERRSEVAGLFRAVRLNRRYREELKI